MTDEDRQYLLWAYERAQESEDPSTQNGAVLLLTNGKIIIGRNGLPYNVGANPERTALRPSKYEHMVHAEDWVICEAARLGYSTAGAVMYAAWAACGRCAGHIINAGIREVVTHVPPEDGASDRFRQFIAYARQMFVEAGVVFREVSGKVDPSDRIAVLRDGVPFYP